MNYRLQPASEASTTNLVRAINMAYHNYFVPVRLTRSSLHSLIQRDAIDMEASVIAEAEGNIVGMALLAIRPPYGWIGGVGVIPSHRRRGIARNMMYYLIEQAQQHRLISVQLEVIEANLIAYHLYLQLNFKPHRRLLMLERHCGTLQPSAGYRVGGCMAHDALHYYDRFHDVRPPWQRSRYALTDLAFDMQGWKVVTTNDPSTVVGYCIGWLHDNEFRMMDIATSPEHSERKQAATALVSHIHHQFPNATGYIFNLGQNDMALTPLQALGYGETMGQVEMFLHF